MFVVECQYCLRGSDIWNGEEGLGGWYRGCKSISSGIAVGGLWNVLM